MQALFYCASFMTAAGGLSLCGVKSDCWSLFTRRFSFGLAFDAAGFIEADVALVAFLALVDVARLAVLFGDLVRLAEAALDIAAAHAQAYLLLDDSGAPFTAIQVVATTVLLDADYCQFRLIFFLALAAGLARFGQWHWLTAAGCGVVGLLQALIVCVGAT